MQKGHTLEFDCLHCQNPVHFSLFQMDDSNVIICSHCQNEFEITDETLKRQLKKFAMLCHQIRESEEILGSTSIGITVGKEQVKIPFKLLLTRLSSCLDLQIGEKKLPIAFRFEPLKDLKK